MIRNKLLKNSNDAVSLLTAFQKLRTCNPQTGFITKFFGVRKAGISKGASGRFFKIRRVERAHFKNRIIASRQANSFCTKCIGQGLFTDPEELSVIVKKRKQMKRVDGLKMCIRDSHQAIVLPIDIPTVPIRFLSISFREQR